MLPKLREKNLRNVRSGGDNKAVGSNGHVLKMFRLGAFIQLVILFGLCFDSSFGFKNVCGEEWKYFGANGVKTLNSPVVPIHQLLMVIAAVCALVLKKLGPLAFCLGSGSCFSLFVLIGLGLNYYWKVPFGCDEIVLLKNGLAMILEILLFGMLYKLFLYCEQKKAEENAQKSVQIMETKV